MDFKKASVKETLNGRDNDKYITPYTLSNFVNNIKQIDGNLAINGNLQYKTECLDNTDLNDFKGIYNRTGYGTNMTNAPTTGGYMVRWMAPDTLSNWGIQSVISIDSSKQYNRLLKNNAWQDWNEVFSEQGDNIQANIKDISNTDLNNLEGTGFFKGYSLTNAPAFFGGTDWWYIQQFEHTGSFKTQLAYPLSGNQRMNTFLIRTRMSDVWNNWSSIRQNQAITLCFNTSPFYMAFPASWTAYEVPFNNTYGQIIGKEITRQGNAIRIGKGFNVVEISFCLGLYNYGQALDYSISLWKNGIFAGDVSYVNSTDTYCTVMSDPLRLPVQEGDLLTIKISKGGTGDTALFGYLTRFNVRAIQ